jgi:hypothetical protein
MELFHHFSLRVASESAAREFSDIGIELQRGPQNTYGSSVASIDIGERDERWITVREIAEKYKITEFVTTKFSEEEINAADTLCIFATSGRGYPEPSKDLGFLAASYDLSTFCAKCGTGLRQINPLRINFKPNLKRSIMQLNWIFDEFFVAREVWTEVFEPFGIGYWPVVLDRTGEEIESVVQLKISHYVDLILDEASATVCPTCGRTKTRMNVRGFCPMPTSILAPIFKSTQYFGSDASAFNRVLVASSLYKEIKKDRLRGVVFYPCGPSLNAVSAPSFSSEPAA